MNKLALLAAVCALTRTLNPKAWEDCVDQDVRGGLPGASWSEGGRSAESALPSLDRDDQNMLALDAEYDRRLRTAYRSLLRCQELESGRMPERYLTMKELKDLHDKLSRAATEEVSSRAGQCANCKRSVERTPEDRIIEGRCFNCYRYRKDHDGQERPRALWEAEIERELSA